VYGARRTGAVRSSGREPVRGPGRVAPDRSNTTDRAPGGLTPSPETRPSGRTPVRTTPSNPRTPQLEPQRGNSNPGGGSSPTRRTPRLNESTQTAGGTLTPGLSPSGEVRGNGETNPGLKNDNYLRPTFRRSELIRDNNNTIRRNGETPRRVESPSSRNYAPSRARTAPRSTPNRSPSASPRQSSPSRSPSTSPRPSSPSRSPSTSPRQSSPRSTPSARPSSPSRSSGGGSSGGGSSRRSPR
jgi:hypothetical protein